MYGIAAPVKSELAGLAVHGTHVPSALSLHGRRYWPAGQAEVLHAEHPPGLRKNPTTHFQAQVFESNGSPLPVKTELGGLMVHGWHDPCAVLVHTPRY